MDSSIQLSALADLLTEFHHPATSNARKHDIEKHVLEFQNSSDAWSHCLYHLSNGNAAAAPSLANQYVWFFTASTIETAITRKWKYLDDTDRQRLRETLWHYYASLNVAHVSRLQREKVAHLIALMGKREFPDTHASYMCHLSGLLKSNFALGITLLRTTSEEVASTRDDTTSDRKEFFRASVGACLPDTMHLLEQLLTIHTYGLSGVDLPTGIVDRALLQALPANNRLSASGVELLDCIQHLLSWIPSAELLHDRFVANLFELSNWREANSEVSVAALGAINELFYRQRTLPFPHIIVNGLKNVMKHSQSPATSELYQDKCTELLQLFMSQQCTRWIDDEQVFPEIITLLHAFTFAKIGAMAFVDKLSIWHPVITGLSARGFGRYTQTLHLLVAGILHKIQIRFDTETRQLDTDRCDGDGDGEGDGEDMRTQWQIFLSQCIETIALVTEVRPAQVFEQVYAEWRKPFEIFTTMQKSIEPNGMLNINDLQRTDLLYAILQDLSSLCQTLTRLAPIVQGCQEEMPKKLSQITVCLMYAIKFIASNKLLSMRYTNSILGGNFVEIFAQLLNCMRNLLTWSPIGENELKLLIDNVSQILLAPSNAMQEPKLITFAAAQFLLTVSTAVRPRFMLDCPSFKLLIQAASNLTHLDHRAASIVRNAIVNCLVLAWPNVSNAEQAFDRRTVMLTEYVHSVADNLLKLDDSIAVHSQHDKVVKVVTVVLPMLNDIIHYHLGSSTSVKHMLANAFKAPMAKTIQVYTQFGAVSDEVAGCVLNFALTIVRALQIPLGAACIREMLDIFLRTTISEQLTVNRYKAVEKLLQMLVLVVRQPGGLGLSMLPGTLDFALNYVAPLLMQGRNPSEYSDVALILYELFDGILRDRWQYFYKSQVLRGFSPVGDDQPEAQPEHSEQLSAILTAYGHALDQHIDPEITRAVLTSLQVVHERCKLFNRQFFKANLLESYLHTLLKVLLSHGGVLHYDQLITVIYYMGQSDMSALHSAFVSIGFSYDAKNIEEICMAKDFPTFSAKLAQIVQDAKCVQLQ